MSQRALHMHSAVSGSAPRKHAQACSCMRGVTTQLRCAGVPTVWLNLLQHIGKHNLRLRYLKRLCVAGSAPPRAMIEALER